MIVLVVGPPGAGKSKQSELLKRREHVEWLYVGKLLRDQNDPAIDAFLDAGTLVDDAIVNRLVEAFINDIPPDKIVIIDGFPRHRPQAEWLSGFARNSHHDLSALIHLTVPADVAHQRLSLRRREDDSPQAIAARQKEYEEDIAPVIDYFRQAGVPIREVDGDRSVETVFQDMDRILRDVHQSQN